MHTPNKNNHNDDLFRATVVLPTAMTYSVGSSSSVSDSKVLNEKKELDEKIQKHESFLDTDLFKALSETEKGLLKSQLNIMTVYSDILQLRINLFI